MSYGEDYIFAGGSVGGAIEWGDPVADLTELNALPSPKLGETRWVVSEEELYTWNGAIWQQSEGDIDGGTY